MRQAIRWVLRHLCKALFRVRIEGSLEGFSASKLLVIANHESFLDGLLLDLFLPVNPVFVLHTGVIRNRFFRLLLTQVDHLVVDPTNAMAMKSVIRLLNAGRPVAIFPEGRITVTGSLMKVYEGPAFVAAKSGATVLPVRLDGPARSYFSRVSGKYPRRLFPRITISVQPPTRIEMPEAKTPKERHHLAAESMRRIMLEMLFHSQPVETLYTALLDAMEIFGKKRRLIEDMKQIEYSYRDLLKMSLALGRIVSKYSLRGENVGVLMPNVASTVAMVFGFGAFGRIPAMLNYTSGTDGMQNACNAARVKTVVTSRVFLDQAQLSEKVRSLRGIEMLYLEDELEDFGWEDKLWLIGAMLFPRRQGRGISPFAPAVVLFTSGSEGKPKGVVLSHQALLSNIAQFRAMLDCGIDDKVFNALPMFHSFGLTAGSLLPILTGVNLFIYTTPLHYRAIPELIYDRNCSVLFGTSTFLRNYAKHAHPYDFYRMRFVIAGAEKLAESVRQLWFEKFGIRILEGYGVTETAPVIAVNTPMAYRAGSVGQLLPAIEARIVPEPGIELGGMLHVRGPNVMSGYYRAERPGVLEPTASSLGAGWHETGDVARIDEDGFLHILGRLKRFAKVAGEMVSLEAVAEVAARASPSFQHAAASRADEERGEKIVLFTTDRGLSRDKLQAAARASGYPEICIPRLIVQVEALPVLGTGKIDFLGLAKMAAEVG